MNAQWSKNKMCIVKEKHAFQQMLPEEGMAVEGVHGVTMDDE